MLIVPNTPFRRRATRRTPPPPVNTNQIQSVQRRIVVSPTFLFVTVQGTVLVIHNYTLALEALVDGNWLTPTGYNLHGAEVWFHFADASVQQATQWRVPDASMWGFEDGQGLGAPLSGNVS